MTHDNKSHSQSAMRAEGERSSTCLGASGKTSRGRGCFPGSLRMSESMAGRLRKERCSRMPGKRNSTYKGTEARECRLSDTGGGLAAWERMVDVCLKEVQQRVHSAGLGCSNPAYSREQTHS